MVERSPQATWLSILAVGVGCIVASTVTQARYSYPMVKSGFALSTFTQLKEGKPMNTNRDIALNTVYQSKHLANNAMGALYDAGEITFKEWLGSDAVQMPYGWMIHLAHIELSRDIGT
jgi:hypothetical protein